MVKNYFNKQGEFMKKIDLIVAILIIIGAINWGLIGMFDFDLIGTIFGSFYRQVE